MNATARFFAVIIGVMVALSMTGGVAMASQVVVVDESMPPVPTSTESPSPTPPPSPPVEYVAPSASLSTTCETVSGTMSAGSNEVFMQLVGPSGVDVWGSGLVLRASESKEFAKPDLEPGTYRLYATDRFGDGESVELGSVVVESCEPAPTETDVEPTEPEPTLTEPEPTKDPTEPTKSESTPDPVVIEPTESDGEELANTGVGVVIAGIVGLLTMFGGGVLARKGR